MIPHKLTIQGLYSYQEKVEIDFLSLTAAHLFGIFGHVGSGKSSILEAITFALYGETDRLNARDNRNYNMMNLKSKTLLIDFEFSTGTEGDLYRVKANASRNRNKYDEVKKIDRKAFKKHGDEWIPFDENKLEDVIGLSYKNFKRAIIIPQGKFQEFLQLPPTDRTKMMKELFNLQKFEFQDQVSSLMRKNKEELNKVQGQLQQLTEVTTEKLTTLQNEKSTTEKKNAALQVSFEKLNKEKQAFDELEGLYAKQKKLEEQGKHLKETGVKINLKEQQLSDYEYAGNHFKALLKRQEEEEVKRERYTLQINENNKGKQLLDTQLKAVKVQLEKIMPELEKKDALIREIDELNQVVKVLHLTKDLSEMKLRQEKGKVVVREQQNRQKGQQEQLQKQETELKKLKNELPDLSMLYNIKEWYTTQKNIHESFTKESEAFNKLVEEDKKLRQQFTHQLKMELFKGSSLVENPKQAIVLLQEKATFNKKEKDKLLKELEQVVVKLKLQEYAHTLHDGEPCPLCGATEHPAIINVELADKEEVNYRNSISSLDKQDTLIQETINQLTNLKVQLQKVEEELLTQKEVLEKVKKQEELHSKLFVWEQYKEESLLQAALLNSEKTKKDIEKLEIALGNGRNELEKTDKNVKRYEQELNAIEQQVIARQSEKKTIQQQLQIIKIADYEKALPNEVSNKAREKDEYLKQLVNQNNKLSIEQSELQTKTVHRAGQIQADEKSLKDVSTQLSELKVQVEKQLQISKWDSLDDVTTLLALQLNVAQVRREIDLYKQQVTENKAKLEEVVQLISDRKYEPEKHAESKGKLHKVEAERETVIGLLGELKNKLLTLEKELKIKADLTKKQEQFSLRAEDLQVMYSLMRTSGFVRYVSTVYLENLCKSANERFRKMTRQQLSLELDSNTNFQVRDYINGGRVRSVKTLSGGQTFQASLSLALALSDNIQKIGGTNENFFFLDEGFGSLDKEALHVVFETLKSLRKENRIVGIISHVEELQQEIPNYIRIENDEEKGSSVKASWAN